jgi:nicotinate-nucleotide pyrophosphorylase
LGGFSNYVWCIRSHRYFCSNLHAIGGKVKITLEFEDLEDAKRAIHAGDAWIALSEISELLRSQRKHDVPMEQTLVCIQEIVADAMPLIYS